jgi:hypothetical protein
MRGSYQLNHLATLVLGLHTGMDPADLRERLNGRGKDAEPIAPTLDANAIAAALPPDLWQRTDTVKLGACAAAVECSKNRRGPAHPFALGFVPGAACFLAQSAAEPTARPSTPTERPSGRPRRP